MFGLVSELRPGDTMVTFQTEWTVERAERCDDGVSLYFKEFPFPWRYGRDEVRVVPCGCGGRGVTFDFYWWQATDKWRHAYRGRRNDRITSEHSICGKDVDLTCAPLTEFHPSCMECWRLIKQLRGDTYPQGWLTSTVTTARQQNSGSDRPSSNPDCE